MKHYPSSGLYSIENYGFKTISFSLTYFTDKQSISVHKYTPVNMLVSTKITRIFQMLSLNLNDSSNLKFYIFTFNRFLVISITSAHSIHDGVGLSRLSLLLCSHRPASSMPVFLEETAEYSAFSSAGSLPIDSTPDLPL